MHMRSGQSIAVSATLTVDPKKYSRLANRIVVKAIEPEEEYDHMVAARSPWSQAYLMGTSGRTAKDLLPVFGTRGRVSEVLSGKRSISKEQAKGLASLFKVAVDLFI